MIYYICILGWVLAAYGWSWALHMRRAILKEVKILEELERKLKK